MPGQTKELLNLIETLDIEPYKKSVLQQRYVSVLQNFQYRAFMYSFMFYSSRIIMTVGSILVPAFLSIQGNPIRDNLYFAAWIISIVVTVSNGVNTLFKIDKKYYFIHMTLELLRSEGWQYIGLTGRYSPKDPPEPPTHENQFMAFFHMAEKIKMRLVEEEYWKFTDTSIAGTTGNNHPMDGMQTPITQQGQLASLPTEQKAIIEEWISAMSKKSMRGLSRREPISLHSQTIKKHHHSPQNLHSVHVDGEESPAQFRRSTPNFSLPEQSNVQEKAASRATVVPETFVIASEAERDSQNTR